MSNFSADMHTVKPETIRYMTRNEADMSFKKRVETVFEWVNPQPNDLILDMPCGRGFYLNMFRYASTARMVGADLDWDVLKKAKRNIGQLPDVRLNHASIYQLPYADNTFDAVILSEVLEHLHDDVAGLREAYRVLKPGGVIAITVPHANYPFGWDPINKTLEALFGTHIQHGVLAGIWANHHRLYTMPQLQQAVSAAGFTIEQTRSFTHHSLPFIHNLVYGLGKPLLESGALGGAANAVDRTAFDRPDPSPLNPFKLAIGLLNWFDRENVINEPPGKPTVNIAIKGRKPQGSTPHDRT